MRLLPDDDVDRRRAEKPVRLDIPSGALEDDVAEGDTLLSVVCDTPDGADQTRAILERSGAREVKLEESGESV